MTRAPDLQAITGFCLVTADLPRLVGFYCDVLGFARHEAVTPIQPAEMAQLDMHGAGRRQMLSLGGQMLFIDEFEQRGREFPDGNAAALWFQHFAIVVDDISEAYARLVDITPISHGGPQQLPGKSGGVQAFKFRDPDGHPLELLQFPASGIPAIWRGRKVLDRQIGLGIDHSAISVGDTLASASFYRALGLSKGGCSRNEGPAQQQLDGLRDVAVEVVAMTPFGATPHLELLGYRTPKGQMGTKRHANDLIATRILWRGRKAGLLRDPDDHLHQVHI